ncbi:hypothetical protein TNCV_2364901 [Trichonephila clavipes]|nr:hypothetical protein TNCV_2364901 [Trichonephila clavipes]
MSNTETIATVNEKMPENDNSDNIGDTVQTAKISPNNGHNVTLQWIPSYCGIMHNGFADTLHKPTSILPLPDPPISYQSIKRIINAKFKAHFREKIGDFCERNVGSTYLGCPISTLFT